MVKYGAGVPKWCVQRTLRLDGQWPRDVASASSVIWMRVCCGCSSCANGLTKKKNPFRPPVGWSSWMVAATIHTVREAAKDCHVLSQHVRADDETSNWFWVCLRLELVFLTVLSGGLTATLITDGRRRRKVADEEAAHGVHTVASARATNREEFRHFALFETLLLSVGWFCNCEGCRKRVDGATLSAWRRSSAEQTWRDDGVSLSWRNRCVAPELIVRR